MPFAVSCETRKDTSTPPSIRLFRSSALSLQLVAGTGLCGRESGSQDPERRTGHVVHSNLVAELYGRRFASVLPANADLQARSRLAPAFNADAHQLAHAIAIDHGEGILLQNSFRQVRRQDFVVFVAREAKRCLSQIVGAEGKELG